jgi:hypothetical protein
MSWKDIKERKAKTGKGLWAQASEDYENAKAKKLVNLLEWADNYDQKRDRKREEKHKVREAKREEKRRSQQQREWLTYLNRNSKTK